MLYVQMTQDFFRDISFLGWWAVIPTFLAGGVMLWNLFSCLLIVLQKILTGTPFVNLRQKKVFATVIGGTTGMQLLIYIYIRQKYFLSMDSENPAYPVIYFLTLALLLIAAIYFFALLISFIVAQLKLRKA